MSLPQIEYRVIRDATAVGLENSVRRFLAEGWCLQSGVSVAVHVDDSETWAQAMVRLPPETAA